MPRADLWEEDNATCSLWQIRVVQKEKKEWRRRYLPM